MKVLNREVSLHDVAKVVEEALIDLGFNADIERLNEHSFDVRVATEDKSVVILLSGVMGDSGC